MLIICKQTVTSRVMGEETTKKAGRKRWCCFLPAILGTFIEYLSGWGLTHGEGRLERQVVAGGAELLQFLGQFLLHLCADLIGALSHDDDTLIHVACLLAEVHQVACHGVCRGICLLEIHKNYIK